MTTGDTEKNRKQKVTGIDDTTTTSSGVGSGGRQTNESTTNNSSSNSSTPTGTPRPTTRNGEDQPLFKKPRLDVSFVMLPEFQCDDGSIILRNCDVTRADDGKGQQEYSTECVGECSTCGDAGFQSELFRCTKCSVRLQHTYCSNSYNPRKRWFIGLCNWCELDVARAGTPGGSKHQVAAAAAATASPAQAGAASKRDQGSPWVEKRNAVDCLLGAALRLPSAGLSNMEELLPQSTRATAKGRKSPSFDTVEKAKRSGPSCDSVVKTSSKRSSGSLSSSTTTSTSGDATVGDGRAQTPRATAAATAEGGGDVSDEKDEKPLVSKRSHHHHHHHAKAALASGAAANGKEGKENPPEISSSSSDSAEKQQQASKSVGGGSGSASEKLSSSTITAARRSPSSSGNHIVTKSKKSPVGDHDDKSESTVDNMVRWSSSSSLRRSTSTNAAAGAACAAVKIGRGASGEDERKAKDGGSSRSPPVAAGVGEKPKATAAAQEPSSCRETSGNSIRRSASVPVDHKGPNENFSRGGGGGAGVDRKSHVVSDGSTAGGSDCSNLSEVQRSGGGFGHGNGSNSSRDTPLRKSQSFKQQQMQSRLMRPNLIIGKSKSLTTVETSVITPRRFADLKVSKLRRSSNSPRVAGTHFKCLSDILC